jgi:hypothetical protein
MVPNGTLGYKTSAVDEWNTDMEQWRSDTDRGKEALGQNLTTRLIYPAEMPRRLFWDQNQVSTVNSGE